jgi:YhcN/YlaJ family sporulation lipoprotein
MKHFLIIVAIITISLTGCKQNEGAIENDQERSNLVHVKNTTKEPVDRKTGQQIAAHLVELATRIPNVKDATAVVLGNYAVVGIDVNSNLDRSRVQSIKYSVVESLKHDPYGANAVVIADADTNVRLRKMAQEIQDGRPVAGILDELATIVGRVMPEVPNDIIDNQNIEPTEQSKNQLNDRQEKELDKKQQQQSNHHKNKSGQ